LDQRRCAALSQLNRAPIATLVRPPSVSAVAMVRQLAAESVAL